MSKPLASSPVLNRLRAAAGLIPLIEDGLRQSTITPEKAALMAEFCAWAANHEHRSDPESDRLAKVVTEGLTRLSALLGYSLG